MYLFHQQFKIGALFIDFILKVEAFLSELFSDFVVVEL
jgi:hypothetical protein